MFQDPTLTAFIGIMVAVSIFMITLLNTNAALVLLTISMLFSPEFSLGGVTGRSVVLRLDDLLIVVIFISWLGKLAMNKQLGLLRSTPLNVPVALFIASALISTVLGILRGDVTSPVTSIFYILKSCEYFLLYFMVSNVLDHPGQVKFFFRVFILTALAVGIYSYFQIVSHGPGYRISAPFEGKPEPNTLAGYLVFVIAFSIGQALCQDQLAARMRAMVVTGFLLIPLIFTYSRGGYLAFFAMYLVLLIFTKKYHLPLLAILVAGLLLAPMVLPHTVFDRLSDTFSTSQRFQIGNVRLAHSPAARIFIWKYITEKWSQSPLFGLGTTGIGFVDTQYGLILGEAGIVGLLTFLILQWRLWSVCFRVYRTVADSAARGICLGFLAGHAGLMLHAATGNVFLIVRIMEPFWLMAAIVTALPRIYGTTDAVPVRGSGVAVMRPQPAPP